MQTNGLADHFHVTFWSSSEGSWVDAVHCADVWLKEFANPFDVIDEGSISSVLFHMLQLIAIQLWLNVL